MKFHYLKNLRFHQIFPQIIKWFFESSLSFKFDFKYLFLQVLVEYLLLLLKLIYQRLISDRGEANLNIFIVIMFQDLYHHRQLENFKYFSNAKIPF